MKLKKNGKTKAFSLQNRQHEVKVNTLLSFCILTNGEKNHLTLFKKPKVSKTNLKIG